MARRRQGEIRMSHDRIEALSRSLADSTSRRSLLKILGVGAAGTAVTAAGLNEALAKNTKSKTKTNKSQGQNQTFDRLSDLPVFGHSNGLNFKGVLTITQFADQGGTLVAIGQLTGKATGSGNRRGGTERVSGEVVVPVTVVPGSQDVQAQVICTILDLTLGPIDLNILGLRLQTNTIRILLTANSQGGLLGSLLCGLLGPIDTGTVGGLVTLLNRILCSLTGLACV
jgi:hypothetical protein